MPTEEFIKKAKEIHGDKYDYSLVDTYSRDEYRRMPIICHKKDKNGKEHGTFLMSLSNHLAGKGCRKCMYEENSKNFSYTQEDFLRESRKHMAINMTIQKLIWSIEEVMVRFASFVLYMVNFGNFQIFICFIMDVSFVVRIM
jgi:hypothetical protein